MTSLGRVMGQCENTLTGGQPCGGSMVVTNVDDPAVWILECDSCSTAWAMPARLGDPALRRRERLERAGLPGRFNGRRFDETPENRPAIEACRAWIASYRQALEHGGRGAADDGGPWLPPAPALYGEAGSGKTHLLVAVCHRLAVELDQHVMFRSVMELLRELQRFDDDVQRTATWERARTVDVLALDDLGAERITDWRLEQLAELIDARYMAELPILITTNYHPDGWEDFLDTRSVHRLINRQMVAPVELVGHDRRNVQPISEGQAA